MIDAVPEGVLVTRDGTIIEANSAICQLTGFAREELIGTEHPFPFFAPDEMEQTYALLRQMRASDRGDHEISMVRKDGSRFLALLSLGVVDDGDQRLGQVITIRDISDRRRREDRLAELAAKDELTGLLNKRSFLVHLAGEVGRAGRYERRLSLAILDLDGFKRINDAVGHLGGDRVLAEVASRLGAMVRKGEHIARVGGDEFGWILPDADAEGAISAVARARQAIAGESFRGMSMSVSAGIAAAEGSIDATELYRRADRALYSAKRAGGGIETF